MPLLDNEIGKSNYTLINPSVMSVKMEGGVTLIMVALRRHFKTIVERNVTTLDMDVPEWSEFIYVKDEEGVEVLQQAIYLLLYIVLYVYALYIHM
jgi:predicted nucleic acid-binding protein